MCTRYEPKKNVRERSQRGYVMCTRYEPKKRARKVAKRVYYVHSLRAQRNVRERLQTVACCNLPPACFVPE